jgi:PPK2 family polyphosphate:nucleotide phosphotransferase
MDYRKRFFVDPAETLRLNERDPGYRGEHVTADSAKRETAHYRAKLAGLQALLYAERRHSLLIVLQAPDAGGKDGTVSHVFTALNPQGTTVTSFKEPTAAERAHDFLWRVHPHASGRGEVAIFNRSALRGCAGAARAQRDRQSDLDRPLPAHPRIRIGLADAGATIVKFFLHISKEEQLTRFAERLEDPRRNWKISESDYTERALWDDYTAAFEEAINATSARAAPWYVIPSNHKWFRNLAVSQIIADTMEDLGMSCPKPSVDLDDIRRRYHRAEREAKDAGKSE